MMERGDAMTPKLTREALEAFARGFDFYPEWFGDKGHPGDTWVLEVLKDDDGNLIGFKPVVRCIHGC